MRHRLGPLRKGHPITSLELSLFDAPEKIKFPYFVSLFMMLQFSRIFEVSST